MIVDLDTLFVSNIPIRTENKSCIQFVEYNISEENISDNSYVTGLQHEANKVTNYIFIKHFKPVNNSIKKYKAFCSSSI